ncbi:NIF domain-containing protein [Gaeumannomyces tritici R3-111a-1]|uniref:Mitochondrial import inner membrane translocase subunit TIM50 n=1 Tax=Gaeumannomyces tritici (strain R3-111a-1) TaxID=644352 RepID=J3NY02_GAET3|nr:NIF domain-containing protein [Gaeumannomyces tritici R3-111a-1]EJT76235.1 NIF domain-containing protein [Gaeumannomyces tritici R3-111a-1]
MRSPRTTTKLPVLFRRLALAGGWSNSFHPGYHIARRVGVAQHPVLALQQQSCSASSVTSLAAGTGVESSTFKLGSHSTYCPIEATAPQQGNMADTKPRRRNRKKAGRNSRGAASAGETDVGAPSSSQPALDPDAPQAAAVSEHQEGANHLTLSPASSDLIGRLAQMIHANGVGTGGAPAPTWAPPGQPAPMFQQALPPFHGASGWTTINHPAPPTWTTINPQAPPWMPTNQPPPPFAVPTSPPPVVGSPLEDYIRQSLRANPTSSPLNQQPTQHYSTQTTAGAPRSPRLDEPARPDDPALNASPAAAATTKGNKSKSLRKSASKASLKDHKGGRSSEEQRDPIVPPSPESGGVPEPAPAYLLRASFTTNRVDAPRPLLVVLDLNGTLLFRPRRREPKHFIARPHARTFLEYIATRFWVAVWSSARPGNVGSMIDSLLPRDGPARDRLVAVWSRDDLGLSRDDYGRRVQVYKRLSRLWADARVARSHPDFAATGACWGQGDTVLVDDSVEKARSEPHNLVCVPEWAGDAHEAPEVLPRVHDYLNELCYQSDVSTYIRANPFRIE